MQALGAMLRLLAMAAREQCKTVVETFTERLARIGVRPISLEDFCEYMELFEANVATKKQFLAEAGVVDEMYTMLKEYEAVVSNMDQKGLASLHEKASARAQLRADWTQVTSG